MKANEALEKSKDGGIYLNGRRAKRIIISHLNGPLLYWISNSNGARGVVVEEQRVNLDDILSDQWEPEDPKVKCEACKMIQYLKNYHCTCEVTK